MILIMRIPFTGLVSIDRIVLIKDSVIDCCVALGIRIYTRV